MDTDTSNEPSLQGSIWRRFAVGSFWSAVGTVIARGLGVLASILVARMLGPNGFGKLGIIQSTVGAFGAVAGFGMGLTATKYVAEYRRTDPERAGRVLACASLTTWMASLLMCAVVVLLAPWLAAQTLNDPSLEQSLRVGSLLLLLGGVTGAQMGALAGFEAFRTIARINIVGGLAAFPLMVGGVVWNGVEGAVWGLVGSLAVNWILSHAALRRESRREGVPFGLDIRRAEWAVLLRFSIPAMCAGLLLGPVTWACQTMLIHQPGGDGLLGIYNAALRIKQLPEMVLGTLMGPLLPLLSGFHGAGDRKSYGRTAHMAFLLSIGIIVPLALLQTAAPAITLWPYGAQYAGHVDVVQWLMLHGVLIGLFSPLGSVIASMGRMWFGFAYNTAWSLCYLGLAAWWIPRYQAAGLAAAYAVTHLVTSLPCVAYIRRHEPDMIRGVPLVPWTIVVLVVFGCCVATSWIPSRGLPMAGGVGAAGVILATVAVSIRNLVRNAPDPSGV